MRYELTLLENAEIEVIDGDRGKNYPHQSELQDNGFCLFLSAKNVTKTGFVFDETQYISKEKDELLNNGKLGRGDIVITTRGTIGNVALYSAKVPYDNIRINSGMLIIRCGKNISNQYLYQALRSDWFQRQIMAVQSGSAQPQLPKSHFLKMSIPLPILSIQQKIANVLQALDDKIELNSAINNNLEQQALALFRHYFMVYEPYGGSAPSGWTAVSLDDVCVRITDGSHYSPADDPDAPYPMYSVKDMETYGFNSSSCKHITEEEFHIMQKNDCVPRLNDILVAKDGSYLKEIFICSEERDEAILSSIAIFRPDTEIIIPEILLYLLKQPSVRKDVGDNYVSGSALPRIVLKDFKKYSFLLPPMTEQSKIGSVLHSIRMQTKANIDEIQRLSALRDALLPRLMSGELDVSDIDL